MVYLSLSLILTLAASSVLAQDDNYAPQTVSCPGNGQDILRLAGSGSSGNQTLNDNERSWVSERRTQLEDTWKQLLSNHSIGYDAGAFNESSFPNLALSVSGGGYRAALYGAGVFNALDGRNTSSVDAGLGGFLQCATYATGLSGGSWFLSSWAIHDAPSPAQLVLGSDSNDTLGWHLENGLLVPDGVLGFFGDNQDYYDALEADVNEKQKAGFNVSITDLWGRALAYHFAPGTTDDNYFSTDAAHGVGYQFSDIAQQPSFVNHNMPFPLVVANLETKENIQPNSTTVIPLGNTVFSFSPYEFGSFDPMLSAFIPTQLTGTALNSGRPQDDQSCVNGFEEFSFIIGTSSSLFNAALHLASQAAADSELVDVLFHLLGDLGLDSEDADNFYALYPNSFRGVAADTFGSSDAETLLLVDGGENGENVPLNPVLASAREVDVIFAIDSSADTEESWPNGTALLASKERTKMLDGAYTLPTFPESAEEFVGGGFNARPTFFGCQESESAAPLVVYMPNAPGTEDDYDTNTSTFKLQYDVEEASAFINTIQMTATRGKAEPGKKDDQYPACLACAVFERGRVRAGLERSDVCKSCLKEYCYDASTREDSLATYEKESSAGVTLRWTPWPWSWVAGGMLLAGLLV